MPELDLQLTNSLPWEKEKQAAFLGHVLDFSSPAVLLRVKGRISPAWFLDGYAGKLYGLWCKFYDQNQRTPASPEEFLHWDDLCGISTPDRVKYKNVMAQATVLKSHFGLDLLQKELTDWLRCRIYHERVEKSAKFFNSRNVTGAVSVLEEAVREFNNTSFDGNVACDWDTDSLMTQISLNLENALTFGHPVMDRVLCPESPKGGLLMGDMTLLVAPTGVGKCLGMGTEVIDYAGRRVKVEDVVAGDLLMGPDGRPRKVLSTTKGRGSLYRITPHSGGSSWVCNDVHVLSLNRSDSSTGVWKDDIINIPLNEYLQRSKTWKNRMKLWRSTLDFEAKKLPICPYVLGIWLGAGHSHCAALTSMDEPIVSAWSKWVESNGDEVLSKLGVLNNKHIPHAFLTGSREQRLQLLAGIIDTDGCYGVNKNYEITQKSRILAEDIAYLARSLGYSVSVTPTTKTCQTVISGGKLSDIPVRLKRRIAQDCVDNPLVSGFSVEPLGVGDYYGFCLDGDHLFLLGDLTVTHNTSVMITVATRNALMGRNVLYVGIEGNYSDMQEKCWMSYLDSTRAQFRAMATARPGPENKQNMQGLRQNLLKHLTFIDVDASNSPSAEEVIGIIRQQHARHRTEYGHGYDLVVVDYPGVLTLKGLSNVKMENRDVLAKIYWHFSQLGKAENFHVLAAVQTNRAASRLNRNAGGGEKTILTLEDVSESFGITHCASNIITVNRSDRDKADGVLSFYISKCRSSRDGLNVTCRSKYSVCRTHDPSFEAFVADGGAPMANKIEYLLKEYNGQVIPKAFTLSFSSGR